MDIEILKFISGTVVAIFPLLKGINFSLGKAAKNKAILEKYKEYLSPVEKLYLESIVRKDIQRSILRTRGLVLRDEIIFLRAKCDMDISLFRWSVISQFISIKYNRFFIRYNGSYRKYRWGFRVAALLYAMFGLWNYTTVSSTIHIPTYLNLILLLATLGVSVLFWFIYPNKKLIKKYNVYFAKVDASKVPTT